MLYFHSFSDSMRSLGDDIECSDDTCRIQCIVVDDSPLAYECGYHTCYIVHIICGHSRNVFLRKKIFHSSSCYATINTQICFTWLPNS